LVERIKGIALPQRFLGYAVVSLMMLLPWLDRSLATALPLALVWGMLALSYNVLLGFAGVPSFGHALPFGLGAFLTAILLRAGFPYLFTIIIAGLAAALAYVAMGLPAYRVKGLYYGILTLATAEAVRSAIESYARTTVAITVGTIPEFTSVAGLYLYLVVFTMFSILTLASGIMGFIYSKRTALKVFKAVLLALITGLLVFGLYSAYTSTYSFLVQLEETLPYVKMIRFLYPLNLYFVSLMMLYISYYIIKRIVTSPLGSSFIAIRENPVRASVIGYNVFTHQLAAFFASGLFAGISGSIYVAVIPTVMPDVFATDKTFIALTGAIIGGLGTLVGPVVGGVIAGILRDYLSNITPALITAGWISQQQAQLIPSFMLGVIYIGVVLGLPYGIWGTWLLKGWKLKRRIEKLLGFETS